MGYHSEPDVVTAIVGVAASRSYFQKVDDCRFSAGALGAGADASAGAGARARRFGNTGCLGALLNGITAKSPTSG